MFSFPRRAGPTYELVSSPISAGRLSPEQVTRHVQTDFGLIDDRIVVVRANRPFDAGLRDRRMG